ncbi:glycoside hydrolase family 28 protein [Fulvivirga maritima]|uniref:glycoside hydrolase family 28 protein n=1 Tax=Fulvivirga maritima TaxID=2904247 RepID=UPI001F2893AA|nr:glycoside hydrolase family 28 protein [Fulvivirga maritima]UII27148.1 glycoside hydrolase family 28 protein [Fulvivirga maritima]
MIRLLSIHTSYTPLIIRCLGRRMINLLLVGVICITNNTLVQAQTEEDLYDHVEFDMPKVNEPTFPDNQVSITDYGAMGNGLFDNTEAFAKAIAAVAKQGGGKVIVPRGVWITGPIEFKSNINLHTEQGALIVFSEDKSKYPVIGTSFEGLETYRCQSPISGRDLENIAITGKGVIDGSGGSWRPVKKDKMSPSQWKALVKSGGVLSDNEKVWYPSKAYERANQLTKNFNVPPFETRAEFEEIKDFLRPVMVSFINCKKVLLDGPTFQNSPAWNLHPLMCEDVIIRNLNVRNPWYSQNGDGLDLESCKNALIYNNTFDVGDDAICIKSGKNEDGRKRGVPTENVIIKYNTVYHGHGGFVVGSEMSGGVKNLKVSHCTFIGTDVGLRFKSTRGRGGVVENIYISDIDMIDIPTEAIRFNMFYGGESPIPEEGQDAMTVEEVPAVAVTEETPSFKNIYMKNITATGSGTAALFQGLPEMKLMNVKLENALLEAESGITMIDADQLELKNVKVINKKGKTLTIYNSSNVAVDKFSFESESNEAIRVIGSSSDKISFTNSEVKEESVVKGKEVKKKAVKLK